uniref:Uncharacterized protein n=1 Tax=Fagus sylvatica TaxID=28930 RepID=A0A2N9IQA7_FAGSY
MNGSTKWCRSSPTRGRVEKTTLIDLHFDGSSPRPVDGSTSSSKDQPPIECFGFVVDEMKWKLDFGFGFAVDVLLP